METYIFFSVIGVIFIANEFIYSIKVKPYLNKEKTTFSWWLFNGKSFYEHKRICKENNQPLTWYWVRVALQAFFWLFFLIFLTIWAKT